MLESCPSLSTEEVPEHLPRQRVWDEQVEQEEQEAD